MRILVTLAALLLGCSHNVPIGPDDASSDAQTLDAQIPADGSSDGAVPMDATADSSAGDPNQSGSRLKQIIITGADGSKQVQPLMLDTQTGCFCVWGVSSPPV